MKLIFNQKQNSWKPKPILRQVSMNVLFNYAILSELSIEWCSICYKKDHFRAEIGMPIESLWPTSNQVRNFLRFVISRKESPCSSENLLVE